jgi:hypothetical protein
MASADELKRGVDLALSGDGDAAHAVAQRAESDKLACWLHACLHKIEGDTGNSRYWYAKAGRRFEEYNEPKAELEAIRSALSG